MEQAVKKVGRRDRKELDAPASGRHARQTNEEDAREWLRANGLPDVANAIEGIMDNWRRRRVKTRRNWWHVLAGGVAGRPLRVSGKVFPVLAAAQRRQGVPVTKNAIELEARIAPPIRRDGRW